MSDSIKVIGVFTTKGGVGKTTLAVNLALLLGEERKTLFVDFDTNYTVSAMLKMELAELSNILNNVARITSRISGVDFVYGGGVKQPHPQVLKRFWDLAGKYDYVVLDFHNSATPLVVALLSKVDLILVPVIPTMAGMGAYIHTVKVLKKLGLNNKAVAIFNQVHKSLFGIRGAEAKIMDKIREGELKVWDGFMPYDKAVAYAELEHRPAVMRNGVFEKSLRRLCREVIGCRQ